MRCAKRGSRRDRRNDQVEICKSLYLACLSRYTNFSAGTAMTRLVGCSNWVSILRSLPGNGPEDDCATCGIKRRCSDEEPLRLKMCQ